MERPVKQKIARFEDLLFQGERMKVKSNLLYPAVPGSRLILIGSPPKNSQNKEKIWTLKKN